jgi:Leucine-rich repeat (LRR) protein
LFHFYFRLFIIVWQICNILNKISAYPDCNWNSFNKTETKLIILNQCSAQTIDVDFLGDQSGTKAKNNYLIEFSINFAGLKTIQANTFNTAYNMTNLDLRFNEISVLEENAFNGLPNLIQLNLGYNNIAVLHAKIFFELIALEEIRLHYNKLSSFTFSMLKNNLNLKIFYANSNNMRIIETTGLRNLELEGIFLSNNSLSTFPLQNLPILLKLRMFHINANKFTEFEFIELGTKFPNLTEFWVRNNPWECYYIVTRGFPVLGRIQGWTGHIRRWDFSHGPL